MNIFANAPEKFVYSGNDGHIYMLSMLFSKYRNARVYSVLNWWNAMSKSIDSILYDGYDINDQTKGITLFLRNSVWCRPTVWWYNSWTSRTISIKDVLISPVISINEYLLFASKVNISLPFSSPMILCQIPLRPHHFWTYTSKLTTVVRSVLKFMINGTTSILKS